MKRLIRKTVTRIKSLVLWCRPHICLGWLRPALFLFANTLSLSKWISKQDTKGIMNDFFRFKRDYSKRYQLYGYVIDRLTLDNEPFDYVEFGVSAGHSIRWWANRIHHPGTRFYGFDTFEGLPENWGTYRKGDMNSAVPQIDDERVRFFKGLFQETVPAFVKDDYLSRRRKIIHMDADLFSSTLYALTSMAPYLNAGDVLFFDEFNVPGHEFLAYRIFSESYYVKTELLGAVNNYYQVAFVIR
jgi:hypothetical protein